MTCWASTRANGSQDTGYKVRQVPGVWGHPTTGRPLAPTGHEGDACGQHLLSRYTDLLGSLLLLVVRCPENRRNLGIQDS